jgi:hypothetical protein
MNRQEIDGSQLISIGAAYEKTVANDANVANSEFRIRAIPN